MDEKNDMDTHPFLFFYIDVNGYKWKVPFRHISGLFYFVETIAHDITQFSLKTGI